MAKPLLDDALWQEIAPLLPPQKSRRCGTPGRRPMDNRKVLTGILFVLKSGIPWEALPQEMGCGSGMTCWRRLYQWQKTGAWHAIQAVLQAKLRDAERIDWARALVGRGSPPATCDRQALVSAPPVGTGGQPEFSPLPGYESAPIPLPLLDPFYVEREALPFLS
jgi:transposase